MTPSEHECEPYCSCGGQYATDVPGLPVSMRGAPGFDTEPDEFEVCAFHPYSEAVA